MYHAHSAPHAVRPLARERRGPEARDTRDIRPGRIASARAGRGALVIVTLAAVLVAVWSALTPVSAPSVTTWTSVSVTEHTTLWDIAREHPVPGLSTVETVQLIQDHNGLPSDIVHAGLIITAPAVHQDASGVARR